MVSVTMATTRVLWQAMGKKIKKSEAQAWHLGKSDIRTTMLPPKPDEKRLAMDYYCWRNWSPEYWTWPSVLLRNGGILLTRICCGERTQRALWIWRESGKGCLSAGLQLFPPLSSPAGNTSATEPTSHTLSIHVSSLESRPCFITWTKSSRHSPTGRTGGCGSGQQSKRQRRKKWI